MPASDVLPPSCPAVITVSTGRRLVLAGLQDFVDVRGAADAAVMATAHLR
jgi:hypothetical protein